MHQIIRQVTIYFFIIVSVSCQYKENRSGVNVTLRADHFPKSLNYYLISSGLGYEIQRKTINELLKRQGLDLKPLVARSLPEIIDVDSAWVIKYEIRQEAKWNDQSPILAEDIAFSLKSLKIPIEGSFEISSYYEPLISVIEDETNTKVLSIVAKGNRESLLRLSTDFAILQKSVFDPDGLLDNVTFFDINNSPDIVRQDTSVIAFFERVKSDPYLFRNQYFDGSGPYSISEIDAGKSITLTKNESWWGHSLSDQLGHIYAYPDVLHYTVIPEAMSALYSLKNGDLDVMDNIIGAEFQNLGKDEAFSEKYNLHTPTAFRFTYVGFNSTQKILKNKKIRRAIAHLIDKPLLAQSIEHGFAEPCIGPVSPVKDYFYNHNLESYSYNPAMAKQLLKEAGFDLVDGKQIDTRDGTPLRFHIIHNQVPQFESIAQVLISEGKKIGIQFTSTSFDKRAIWGKLESGDFDLAIGSFGGSPFSYDYSVLFETAASGPGGMNLTSFGNAQSDSIIQVVKYASDSTVRKDGLLKLQEMLHEEATMIFLYFSKNKIAISKRFTNTKVSSIPPGYDVMAFQHASTDK